MIGKARGNDEGIGMVEMIFTMMMMGVLSTALLSLVLTSVRLQSQIDNKMTTSTTAQSITLSFTSLIQQNAVEVSDYDVSGVTLVQVNKNTSTGQQCVSYQLNRNTNELWRKASSDGRVDATSTYAGWTKIAENVYPVSGSGFTYTEENGLTVNLRVSIGSLSSPVQTTVFPSGGDSLSLKCLASDDLVSDLPVTQPSGN